MREPGNPFSVAVMRSSVTVSQKLRGSSIRLGVATQNPQSMKLFPQNFVKGHSANILPLENLALYSSHYCCYGNNTSCILSLLFTSAASVLDDCCGTSIVRTPLGDNMKDVLSFVERLSSFGGSKCIRTIGKPIVWCLKLVLS